MERLTRVRGSYWPDDRDRLVLRAALLRDDRALASWQELRRDLDLDRDGGELRRLLPLLATNLDRLGVDDSELPRLRGIHRHWAYRMGQLLEDTATAVRVLDGAGVPALLFRGVALGSRCYEHPSLRPCTDADVLVPPWLQDRALEALRSSGWHATGNAGGTSGAASIELTGATGTRLVAHVRLSEDLPESSGAVTFPALWASGESAVLPGTDVRIVPITIEVVRTCLEGLRGRSGCVVRSLMDLHVIVSTLDVDWGTVEDVAARHGAVSAVRDALIYLQSAIGTEIEDAVVDRFTGRRPARRDRLAHVVGSTRSEVLGEFPRTISRYLRSDPDGGLTAAAVGLAPHLRDHWSERSTTGTVLRAMDKATKGVGRKIDLDTSRGARSGRRVAGSFVLDCVRDVLGRPTVGSLQLPSDPDLARLVVEVGARHRVLGFVRRAVEGRGGEVEGLPGLAERHRVDRRLHLLVLALLDEVATAFEATVDPWLVVKGPVLGHAVYGDPTLRSYSDLDLLVHPVDFGPAVEALESSGFEVMDRNWVLVRDLLAGELMLRRPARPAVDLHWHLLFDDASRRRFPIPVGALIERSRVVDVAGRSVRTLDACDTLLHLTVHACQEGGGRLVWLVDIDRAAEDPTLDWACVVERARAWRVQLLVGAMLRRARSTLGTPVPEWVLEALQPGPVDAGLRLLDHWFPPEHTEDRGTPSTLVARSTAPTVGGTLFNIGTGVAQRARHAASSRSLDFKPTRLDPSNPGSVLYAAGGPTEREQFFAAVGVHA